MYSKDYYIQLFQRHFISFNPNWEDPITASDLVTYTEETLDSLEFYLKFLGDSEKKLIKQKNKMNDYNDYPDDVKLAIKNIVMMVSDGRDLWHDVEYKHCPAFIGKANSENVRVYNHHVEANGHLSFENRPWEYLRGKLHQIEELREVLNSEKATTALNSFINGKWYLFQGYENGSMSVRFSKINKNKDGNFTYDGDVVVWTATDSSYNGDGVLFYKEVEDWLFAELPGSPDSFKNEEECGEFIERAEVVQTDEELRCSLHDYIDECLKQLSRLTKLVANIEQLGRPDHNGRVYDSKVVEKAIEEWKTNGMPICELKHNSF